MAVATHVNADQFASEQLVYDRGYGGTLSCGRSGSFESGSCRIRRKPALKVRAESLEKETEFLFVFG
jgi:hypothetical protein